MTFLRSMYAVPEERWLYRVRSTEVQLPDDSYEWLYFHAESGHVGCALLDTIIELHGEVIDISTAQVFDELNDVWFDLHWDM